MHARCTGVIHGTGARPVTNTVSFCYSQPHVREHHHEILKKSNKIYSPSLFFASSVNSCGAALSESFVIILKRVNVALQGCQRSTKNQHLGVRHLFTGGLSYFQHTVSCLTETNNAKASQRQNKPADSCS